MRPFITRSEEIMLLIKEYEWQISNKLYTAASRTYDSIEDNIARMEYEMGYPQNKDVPNNHVVHKVSLPRGTNNCPGRTYAATGAGDSR